MKILLFAIRHSPFAYFLWSKDMPVKPKPPIVPTQPAAPPEQAPQMWAYWPQPPAPQPTRSIWRSVAFLGLGWAVAIILAVVVAALVGLALFLRSDWIVPGVSAAGLDLGRRSTAEAATLLQQQWQQRQITLVAGQTSQNVTPETLGVTLDAAATAQLARQQGRSLPTLRELLRKNGQIQLLPVRNFDPALALKNLEILAPQFAIPAKNAEMRLVAGRVEALPGAAGQVVDIPATMTQLTQNPAQIFNEGRFQLVLTIIEPEVMDLSGPVAQANQLLANPITLRAYDPISGETMEWIIGAETWGDWLSLGLKSDDPTQLDWSLDVERARAGLAEKTAGLGPERYLELETATAEIVAALKNQNWPVRLRIFHHERQYTVQAGETLSSIGYNLGIPYPWIEQANPGLGDSLRPGQTLTIPSPDGLLPLPPVASKRLVVSLSQQKVWAYEQGAVKWEWLVSTGIPSSPTAPGVFQVQTHELNAYAASWNLWMPNFIGIYRPVPTSDFMNGFHGYPSRDGRNLLWVDDLGRPVTYGCIMVSAENAVALYEWAEAGVVVEVQK
jgi:lipoprotein-anchoring transpeptidase ErfK/SrfK